MVEFIPATAEISAKFIATIVFERLLSHERPKAQVLFSPVFFLSEGLSSLGEGQEELFHLFFIHFAIWIRQALLKACGNNGKTSAIKCFSHC